MQNIDGQLRDLAKKLLEEKKVDLVIGYEKGTMPLRTRPVFIKDAADADKLVWNSSCENNLAAYLRTAKGKVAIIAKGCDSRSIVGYLKENQIEKDNVFVIGVSCEGVIDRKRSRICWKAGKFWRAPKLEARSLSRGMDLKKKWKKIKSSASTARDVNIEIRLSRMSL